MGRVVAIDGPSGAGKSTVSKAIAERLGFQYLDTGALYRAAALFLRERGVSPDAAYDEMALALKGASVMFRNGRVFLNSRDISEDIRTTEAGHYASVFSAKKAVRDSLLQLQRDAATACDIVAEGRDMGTVVFPDAWIKIYLDASEEGRAKRRYLQLKEKGMEITMQGAINDVRERDIRDSGREIAPLKKADDAHLVDTTHLSFDEVIEKILKTLDH